MFSPKLPDELVISVGERLTVVSSFDDGWYTVGRDSILKPGEVEMGTVPSWCFVKPVEGFKPERPTRISSLGMTVEPEPEADQESLISWSHFY